MMHRSSSLPNTASVGLTSLRVLALCLPLFAAGASVHASTEIVVYKFKGIPDGSLPQAGLSGDSAGNGYGTTASGGAHNFGTVYKITPTGQETVLHSFSNGADGSDPQAGVTLGHDGNFYGTTHDGGAFGFGVVYKMTPAGLETVLHAFTNGTDGANPQAGVIQGKDGNFYGTTYSGGAAGYGTVYQVTPSGTLTTLHAFTGAPSDGQYPYAGVIQAKDGSFYGTTFAGGSGGGYGTVYKITATGLETVLYSFTGAADGTYSYGGLIQAKDGNFYGTTTQGGVGGDGVVYKMTSAGQESVLHAFTGGADGATPFVGVIQAADGDFYGTTYYGGASGDGTVYQVTPTGQETVLHAFTGTPDGALPDATLIQDRTGSLYGTTAYGGPTSNGVIFRITL